MCRATLQSYFGNVEGNVESSANSVGLVCEILQRSKDSIGALCVIFFLLRICGVCLVNGSWTFSSDLKKINKIEIKTFYEKKWCSSSVNERIPIPIMIKMKLASYRWKSGEKSLGIRTLNCGPEVAKAVTCPSSRAL